MKTGLDRLNLTDRHVEPETVRPLSVIFTTLRQYNAVDEIVSPSNCGPTRSAYTTTSV